MCNFVHVLHSQECLRFFVHVKGPKSFEDLRTVEGEVCATYHEACIKLGLFEGDDEIEKALEEAYSIKFGKAFRQFFVTILLYAVPANPLELYEKFKDQLCEDYCKKAKVTVPTERSYLRISPYVLAVFPYQNTSYPCQMSLLDYLICQNQIFPS